MFEAGTEANACARTCTSTLRLRLG